MGKKEFPVIVKALITFQGRVLIGQKEEDQNHPIGGEWHVPGGHFEKGEKMKDAVLREVKEETGLDVELHHIVDVMSFRWSKEDERNSVQIYYHCEADSREAVASDDLQDLEWVKPEEVTDKLDAQGQKFFEESKNLGNFLKKLEKMPSL